MKKVKFKFIDGDSPIFKGFSDGTQWNGYDNVFVDKKTHDKVLAFLLEISGLGEFLSFIKNTKFKTNKDGLVSYANGIVCVKIVDSLLGNNDDIVTKGNLSMLDKDELEDMLLQLHKRSKTKDLVWMLRKSLNRGLGGTKWNV